MDVANKLTKWIGFLLGVILALVMTLADIILK
jgi:hypothetical protein